MRKKNIDYKKLYTEMIFEKYPQKASACGTILKKKEFTVMDVIRLNKIISSGKAQNINQKYKSYDRNAIFEILEYQKKHRLNNVATARHFNISRNTLGNWKKQFLI